VGNYLLWAGCLVLALGFICLAPTLGGPSLRHRGLRVLAYLQAAVLLAFVVTHAADTEVAANLTAVAGGLVIGPALAILIGRALVTGSWDRSPAQQEEVR
jgi:hypothetical protein